MRTIKETQETIKAQNRTYKSAGNMKNELRLNLRLILRSLIKIKKRSLTKLY